jgi:3-oxoacyl-(acyl-carrier-protein) synthase
MSITIQAALQIRGSLDLGYSAAFMTQTHAYIRSVGTISPHGADVRSLIDALGREASCPLREPPSRAGRQISTAPSGWIEPIPRPDRWPARRTERKLRFGRLDRLAQLALVSAHQAAAAGDPPPAAESCGILLGTAFGAHLSNERFQLGLEREGSAGASPALFTFTLPSAATGEICIQLGLKGAATTMTQGLGAGLTALASAAEMVRLGRALWMLAGGVEVLSPTLVRSYEGSTHPLAEGAAFVTLAPTSQGALARVAAAAQTFGEDADRRAVKQALERAGLTDEQLRSRWHIALDGSDPPPLLRCLGQSFAAAPMLALCALVARGEEGLPALFIAEDPLGGADAVCLTRPRCGLADD